MIFIFSYYIYINLKTYASIYLYSVLYCLANTKKCSVIITLLWDVVNLNPELNVNKFCGRRGTVRRAPTTAPWRRRSRLWPRHDEKSPSPSSHQNLKVMSTQVPSYGSLCRWLRVKNYMYSNWCQILLIGEASFHDLIVAR